MAIEFKFIGWCREGSSDKVWGVVLLEKPSHTTHQSWPTHQPCFTFWGRRGRALQTKQTVDNWEIQKLIESKIKNGYQSVDRNKLDEVYPEFETDLKETALWCTLKL